MKVYKNDIIIRLINLPTDIKGFCSPSPDGTYNVYLNAKHSHETLCKTYKHELEHIKSGDFESSEDVSDLELRAKF